MCRFVEHTVSKTVHTKKLKNINDMNKIINKIFPILTLAFALSLTACLTDSAYDNNQIGINPGNNKFVEVHLTSSDGSNSISTAYDHFNRDTTVVQFIPVNLTEVSTNDVTVTFQLEDAKDSIMAGFISAGNAIPDPTKFTVQNAGNKVVIKAGTHTGYISVKFNPANLGGFFIFGVKLTAVSDPKYAISNLATGYVKFGIKNQYDGNYLCKGYRIRPGNPTEPIADNTIEAFNTVNATTLLKSGFGDYFSYNIQIEVTTNTITVGGVTCFKVNATPVNGATVVGDMFTTFTGDPLTPPAIPTNPTEINYYNPVTKTFVLNCYYVSGAGNRIMYEVDTLQ